MVFSISTGPVNAIIRNLGAEPINFMGSSHTYRWMIVLSSIWKEVGWGSIVYLAAMAGIDEQLYEAARVDGAGRLRCLMHITLPGIAGVISIMLILRVGSILDLNFDQTLLCLTMLYWGRRNN